MCPEKQDVQIFGNEIELSYHSSLLSRDQSFIKDTVHRNHKIILFYDLLYMILRLLDYFSGEPMVAAEVGVWDNYCVKKQLLHSCTMISTNIPLVDEIMLAAMFSLKVWIEASSVLPELWRLQSDSKNTVMEFLFWLQMIFKGFFFSHMETGDIQVPNSEIIITVLFYNYAIF